MLAPTVKRSSQLISVRAPKTCLLLVSDSAERLRKLQSSLENAGFEVRPAGSLDELKHARYEDHDVVAIDAGPQQIEPILKLIRLSVGYAQTPVFVESTRINNDSRLAGVLPYYRAMPCTSAEMLKLLRRYTETTGQTQARRSML
jgi:DNA-binding NtrC family response regulator